MFDIDTYKAMYAENQMQMREINERKNEIMRMKPSPRKQAAWDNLYPKLPASNIPY